MRSPGSSSTTSTTPTSSRPNASRFYRLLPESDLPPRTGPIGGDLGYVKYGTFVGDNRTFSITLAVPSYDDELRRRLSDPAAFDAAARSLPATAPWLDGRAAPLTPDVHMMAGLLNEWSAYVVDGEPAAIGHVPIGCGRLRRSAAIGDPSVAPLVGRTGPRGSAGGSSAA